MELRAYQPPVSKFHANPAAETLERFLGRRGQVRLTMIQ